MNDTFLSFGLHRPPSDPSLHLEAVSLNAVARDYGTPCFVYSKAAILAAYQEYCHAFQGFSPLICYAVKANANLAILRLLARQGAGFDIVSGGELYRVLKAGGEAQKVVFSGVGKSIKDMDEALMAGILCFNVESSAELRRLAERAQVLGVRAPISVRVNPEVDAQTHPYIATGLRSSKFGVDAATARRLYREAADSAYLRVVGIDCHIGSQITTLEPFLEATDKILELVHQLEQDGISLDHIDLGGGVGIHYQNETPPALINYALALSQRLHDFKGRLLFEPGRRIVGNAGVLLTRVEYLKDIPDRQLAIVDAGMNDLMRPSLYHAWHDIVAVEERSVTTSSLVDVVGPVCESSDILGTQRNLALEQGDLLAILSAGAYGSSMGSQYNARPKPPELLVDGDTVTLIRQRETYDDLIRHENVGD
ncbi:MAG: diaminopimelate decarboxylase [Ferrovum sp.]|nr:diaminopimelate decarboxylase [Ferrovum sp.]NDU87526.1 diaminopimelate decarboxylase [Ferrovum sp.]